MTFDIVIPNYNGSEIIRKNLPSVIEAIENHNQAKIIILDDGSKLEDYEKLKDYIEGEMQKYKSRILLIRKDVNRGFSSAVNSGIKESKADLIVLLNSDVSPQRDFLKFSLSHFDKDDELFGVGLMDKSVEGEKTIYRGRGEASWKRGFLVHRKGDVTQSDTFWIAGGSSIFRREVFNLLHGFDEIYNPFYWEDIDLSYRARKSGFKLLFDNKSIVTHRHEEGAIKKNYNNFKVTSIAYRNQFIFVWKDITSVTFLLSHIFWLPYHMVRAILRFDTAFLYGFAMAFFRLPAIINKRNIQSRLYKLSDQDII